MWYRLLSADLVAPCSLAAVDMLRELEDLESLNAASIGPMFVEILYRLKKRAH